MKSIVLIILSFLFLNPNVHGQVNPAIHWRVLKTAHFEIIYDREYRATAEAYAQFAEVTYSTLEPYFKEMPRRTLVVISDHSDSANGFATFLPYPLIHIYPVLPNALDSISHYGNWGFELFLHEYAHILNFKPAHGIYTPFKYIFGTVVRPNALLPRWWLEGLAVDMESRFSRFGRLKSPSTSAALRALALDRKWSSIDQINESDIPSYPFGSRPYLFGSLLLHESIHRAEPGFVERINQRYSRRLPFLLNAPLRNEVGLSYSELLNEILSNLEAKALKQKTIIESNGKEDLHSMNFSGFGHISPSISPNGRYLVFASYEMYRGGDIKVVDRGEQKDKSFSEFKPQTLMRGRGFLRISWIPDSSGFIYDRIETHNRYHHFRDLYHFDLSSKKSTRLTSGLRAFEPSVSPDGQKVAFVRQTQGFTELGILHLSTGEHEILLKPPFQTRISNPEFINNEELVFSGRSQSGAERLYRFHIASQSTQRILSSFKNLNFPKNTPQGLLFSSTDSGAANIFLSNKDFSSARPITNTLTEVLQADYDPFTKELISSRLTSEGRKLHMSRQVRFTQLPQIELLQAQYWPQSSSPLPSDVATSLIDSTHQENTTTKEVYSVANRSYQPIRYLLPRYWIPFIYPVDGGFIFQGTTGSSDPLGKNVYLLDASYDNLTEKLSYGVAYTNHSTPVGLGASHVEINEYLGASSLTLTQRFSRLSSDFFLPGFSNSYSGHLSWSFLETQNTSQTLKRTGPSAQLSYNSLRASHHNENNEWAGHHQILMHYTHYIQEKEFISYDRYGLNLHHRLTQFLPSRHAFSTSLKGTFAPNLPISSVISLGDKTIGANYLVSLLNSSFLMRGYPSAAFVGRSIINTNIEYSFPLFDIYRGRGLFPFFARHLETSIFVDGVAVDGAYAHPRGYIRSQFKDQFWSSGIDFKLHSTLAYHLPLAINLGLYYGFDSKAQGGFMPFLGIGYTGHTGTQ